MENGGGATVRSGEGARRGPGRSLIGVEAGHGAALGWAMGRAGVWSRESSMGNRVSCEGMLQVPYKERRRILVQYFM